jgi:hypothetical protein
MRRFLVPLTVFAASVAIGLAMVEVGLRILGYSTPIWYQPDPVLGWSLRPGADGWNNKEGRAHIRINSEGWRDREHALEKKPGVYRVAVLGDSYVEAMQVDEKDAFWRVVEGQLAQCSGKPVEVLSFGVSGYGTAQEYLVLESTASRYRPDTVLLAFTTGNDLRNNSATLEPENERPFYRLEGSGLALNRAFAESERFHKRSSPFVDFTRRMSDHVRLAQLASEAKHFVGVWRSRSGAQAVASFVHEHSSPEAGLDYSVLAPPKTSAWEEAWTITERILGKMNDFARIHGERLVVTDVTSARQVDPDPRLRAELQKVLGVEDLFYVERRLQKAAAEGGYRAIALAPEMQKRAEAEGVYFHGFPNVGMGLGHWNENGHKAAGEIIARELCAQGL